jgi:hypothetical protein
MYDGKLKTSVINIAFKFYIGSLNSSWRLPFKYSLNTQLGEGVSCQNFAASSSYAC